MASYEAQINLLVSGQQQLDRLADRLRSIERQIVDINRLGVRPQQRDPETGRFGADPDRANRIRLRRLQEIGQQEERRASRSRRLLEGQNSELLNSIRYHSQLNAAVDLYQRKLQELSRGGGGRRLTEDLRNQVDQIQRAFDTATAGGTTNLRLVRSLATELGRVVERQNEINRLSTFQSKAYYQAQAFERRMAGLRAEGVGSAAFSGVGRQMREYRSAVARGSEFEAGDIARRIKETLDRIQRELDAAAEQITARVRERDQRLRDRIEARNTAQAWSDFFRDARNEALRLRQQVADEAATIRAQEIQGINERLDRFRMLRGNSNQYRGEQIGPLPFTRAGGPTYYQEAQRMAQELLAVENDIGATRDKWAKNALEKDRERLANAKEIAKQAGNVLLDAVSFGKSQRVKDTVNNIKTGSRNALVRGGLGLGALGIGGLYQGAGQAISGIGNLDYGPILNTLKGPVSFATGAIGEAVNNALGGIPEIVNNVLSALGDIPSALGLAAVAAYAFAPAMKTAGDAVFLAGKKFGESKFGQNVKLTLDRQTNLFESVINAATEMNMVLDASKSGLDAVGRKVESLPLLPAAGQTSFTGEMKKGRGGAFMGGGAREILNPEYLVNATGQMAQRTEMSAASSLLFAEGLGQAANEAKAIADYLKEASDLRVQTETKTQQFIRETVQKGRMKQRDQQTVDDMRARSAMLQGGQYSLAQVPARGELFPGGRTETRMPDYRGMLNTQAQINQYAADALEIYNKQHGLSLTEAELQEKIAGGVKQRLSQHKAINGLRQDENQLAESLYRINKRSNEEDKKSIEIIRERSRERADEIRKRPVASMTPQERVAAGILDPESLRQQRLFRIREGRTPDFMKGLTAPGGILSGLPGTAGRKSKAVQEGLVGGAFPLLFGQGIGASAGGLLGGVAGGLMGGGLGMGLSLLGTSIGGFLDQAVIKAQELGNALMMAGDNAAKLRQNGLYYTADLEDQVRLLKEQGNYQKAQDLQTGALTAQTGDIGGMNTKAAAAGSNELLKAWKGVQAAVGNTLATLAAPFMFVLALVLRGVQEVFKMFNKLNSGLLYLLNLIPAIRDFNKKASEDAIKGTEEYENQLAEINKQIVANEKNNKILAEKNNIIQQALGGTRVEFELATKRAEAQQRAAEFEKELLESRRNAPTGTAELRGKQATIEFQMRQKFYEQERGILIANAQQLYADVTENARKVAQQQKEYDRQYDDMVRQNIRAQQDLELEAARKVQDIRMDMREKELQYAKQIADLDIKAARLADEQRSFDRGINASISGNPQDNIINTVETAIEKWRTGRREVEQEYAAKQQEIQLQAQRAEIALQRYKYDNALKIARANEDSEIKVARIQEKINEQNLEASKMQARLRYDQLVSEFEASKLKYLEVKKGYEEVMAGVSSGAMTLTESGVQTYNVIIPQFLRNQETVLMNLSDFLTDLDKTIKDMPKLRPFEAPKGLTNPSAPVTEAQKAAKEQAEQFAKQIAELEKIQGLKKEDLELAKALLDPSKDLLASLNEIVKAQNKLNQETSDYRYYVSLGYDPEMSKAIVDVAMQTKEAIAELQRLKKAISELPEFNIKGSVAETTVQKIDEMISSSKEKGVKALNAVAARFSPEETLRNRLTELEGELNKLRDNTNLIIGAAESIGNAFSESFKSVINGSATAQEALAGFFQNVANYFLDMASQIISSMIQMQILNTALGLLPGSKTTTGPNITDMTAYANQIKPNANGNMFMNGIQPFARGGIVSSPTLFKFANGGAMRTGLMGEAGPEAIMPLSRGPGGRLGVDASGSGGDVNVTVNVDASGSKVQGDNGQARELGRAISTAVQQELIKQKRPGGLLG